MNYDDPDNFKTSTETHPSHRKMCMARDEEKDDVIDLQTCPDFDYEDEYQIDQPNIYCRHCWALGDYSVCDKALKE